MHTLKAGKEFRKAPSCSNFIKQLRSKPYQTNLVEALGQPTQPRQPDSCILADWVFKRCQQTEVELYPCILLLAALLLGGGNGLASPVSPSSSIPISRLSGPSRGVNKQRWGCILVSCFSWALLLGRENRLTSPVSPGSCIPASRLSEPSRGVNKQRCSCIPVL
jgi:hypothetical protein